MVRRVPACAVTAWLVSRGGHAGSRFLYCDFAMHWRDMSHDRLELASFADFLDRLTYADACSLEVLLIASPAPWLRRRSDFPTSDDELQRPTAILAEVFAR